MHTSPIITIKTAFDLLTVTPLSTHSLPTNENQPPVNIMPNVAELKTQKVAVEKLYSMKKIYLATESKFSLKIKTCVLHLYPTDRVIKIINHIVKRQLNDKDISAFIIHHFNSRYLKISEDTTFYYSETSILKRVFIIGEDNIYRKASKDALLDSKGYIFIIDALGRLIIGKKGFTTSGRIQHSSLSQGQPVKAAGILMVKKEEDKKKRSLFFTNYSGHYQTPPQSLNHVERLFVGLPYTKEIDQTYRDEEQILTRDIKFTVDLSKFMELTLESLSIATVDAD